MNDPFQFAVDATFSGDDVFTNPITLRDSDFVIAVSGTFTATVTLQVRPAVRDVEHDWTDEATYGQPDSQQSRVLRGIWQVRAGIKSGDYASGSIHVTIAS